jgi:iron complex outermembrane receptor protein
LDASNVIRAGLEYRTNSGTPDIGPVVSYDDYAANFMWDWQISPSVDLTNAFRVDHLVLHISGLPSQIPERTPETLQTSLSAESFNSGLVIHVTDRDTVRIMLSRGLQLPSILDFGLDTNLLGLTLLGSPNLAPESVWNAELAYDRTLPRLGAKLTEAIFLQRNTDLLAAPGNTTLEVVGGQPTEFAANIGSTNELGVEIGLASAQNSRFRWNVSYRYTAIVDDITHSVPATAVSSYNTGTPAHVVIVGAGYTFGRWELDMQARGQTKYRDFANLFVKQTVPGYVSFNARVGFRVTDYLTLGGTAEQLNVSRYLDGADFYVDRRFIASATLHY